MGEGRIRIIADRRENGSGVVRWLRELAEVELRNLPAGDYVVSDRVIVERKSADDFLQSIVDRRLVRQAGKLSLSCERPVLIVEGNKIFSRRLIHPNAIRGAMASIVLDHGLSILRSEDEEDTAKIIVALARREQLKERRDISIRAKIRKLTLGEIQRFVVEGLPGISSVLAERLLKRFGTVERIMSASQEELMETPGIGRKKARTIRLILTSRYGKD
ncbi:MAG: ERCC4 domain-containing protein [Candidatus Hadarchaeales archaeon]